MIPLDKQAHFLGGWALAATVVMLGHPLWVAAAVVFGVGCIKEVYDAMHSEKHTADPMDLLATCCGWLPVAGIQTLA